jgi:alkylhydroperoxidase family enzyme
MRLPEADPAASPQLAEALKRFRASRGIVSNVMKSYGHAPEGLSLISDLGAYCRYGTDLTELQRELVILAVGRGVAYAWHHHRPIARKLGLSDTQLDALQEGAVPAGLGPAEAAMVAYALAYATLRGVPPVTFAALSAHLSPRQITDVNITAGYYLCIASNVIAMEVELDPPQVVADGTAHAAPGR